MERPLQETPTTALTDQLVDPHQTAHDALTSDSQRGIGTRIKERIKPTATEIMGKIDETMPDREEAQRVGQTVMSAMKQTWQTVRQKSPEFLKAHKREIILGLGTYATGRIAAGKSMGKSEMKIPMRAKALSKIQALPTEAKSKIHEMTE